MSTKFSKLFKKILQGVPVVVLICCYISCKKISAGNNNRNELKATVKLISGQIILISATGDQAKMFCYTGFSIDNNNQYPQPGLSLQTFKNSGNCITLPGTYFAPYFICSFGTYTGTQSILYDNTGVNNTDSIKFTSFSNTYVECHFFSVCKRGANDSVIINGTFKGNHMTP